MARARRRRCVFLIVAMAGPAPLRRTRSPPTRRRRGSPTATCCGSCPALALQFVLATMAAALRGTGAFRAPMLVQVVTVAINIVLAPILIFGWGTGAAFGVAGAAIASLVAIAVGVAWLTRAVPPAQEAFLRFRAADAPPRPAVWRPARRHRPAGRRRVQPDGRLHVPRLAVARPFGCGGPGRLRHRAAPGAGVLPAGGRARRSRPRRWPARTSARGASIACARPCSRRSAWPSALMLARRPWSVQFAAAALVGVFSADPAVIARRRRLPADHLLGLRVRRASSSSARASSRRSAGRSRRC